jgi:hypothetical protein
LTLDTVSGVFAHFPEESLIYVQPRSFRIENPENTQGIWLNLIEKCISVPKKSEIPEFMNQNNSMS